MKKVLVAISILIVVIVILLLLGKKQITTGIVIDAPADAVWAELTDFPRYPEWNPFIKKVSGEIAKGGTIEVTFHTKGSDPVVFTPTILANDPNSLFQWEGRLLMPGIFTGRHTFQLETIDAKKTRLVQKEDFNGILVLFFNFDSTVEGFTLMNEALKKRVEGARKRG
ncbi:MAG TPA: SRPBCC domain-containing protein [Spirochaetota bacterium]|nr:SRPBCC domain-containing protein [Spirochaetota bacterium]HOD16120.1 SRPBCC domain-containing protein [Spirochaetota bacterium]HPG52225.1 SRPBCC domain-containing protein [Spirochaetota bacterium]HPN14262.1 SRPBCC domain-containing protein [Spirochaetota bacterium]